MANSSAQDRAMQRSLQASPSAGAFFFKMKKKLLNEPDLMTWTRVGKEAMQAE
jgi:hypothetical protein